MDRAQDSGPPDAPSLWTIPALPGPIRHFVFACLVSGLLGAVPVAVSSALAVNAAPTPQVVLAGHTGGIADLAFTRDASVAASVGADRALRLWSGADGQEVGRFEAQPPDGGRPPVLWRVAFSPDGRTVAAGADDGSTWLWPLDGAEARRLGDGRPVSALAFSPDGTRLAVGSADGTVRLWDLEKGRALRTLYAHVGAVSALGFAPDGVALASGGWDDKVVLWDTVRGRQTDTLAAEQAALSLAFSPDGDQLALAGSRGVILWDLPNGGTWRALPDAPGLRDLVFAEDGRSVAVAASDGTAWHLDPRSGREPTAFRVGAQRTLAALSPDRHLLATAPLDGRGISVWAVPPA